MIPALVVLLLAQAPVSPPPLVAADVWEPVVRPEPVTEPMTAPPLLTATEDDGSFGGRLAASFTGALIGAVPAVATIGLGIGLCNNDPDCATVTLLVGVIAAPVATGLGAYLAHRLAGGQGTVGKAIAGAALGWGLTMFGVYGLGLVGHSTSAPMEWGIVGAGSAVAFLITAAMLEYSHRVESLELGLAFAPVDRGGVLSFGGRF